ncbi:hypothetical protein PIB30_061196 [Stylosanthes scabra]|uniref:Uncharacterized protein n=1 Tax=Stylosanthes scabra TaxID=79078 RepID=A0ABU6VN65_9FABA|nr:hypothetical protein [Stylosanthes scabra]
MGHGLESCMLGWRFIRTKNPWVGDSHSVCISDFSGAGSSLEGGEACCGLDSPDVRVFRCVFNGELESYGLVFYKSKSSVCSATVSAERVRSAVSHTGVLHLPSRNGHRILSLARQATGREGDITKISMARRQRQLEPTPKAWAMEIMWAF